MACWKPIEGRNLPTAPTPPRWLRQVSAQRCSKTVWEHRVGRHRPKMTYASPGHRHASERLPARLTGMAVNCQRSSPDRHKYVR
jgi:hypothetical protein